MNRLTIMTPTGAALKMGESYVCETDLREDLMRRYRVAIDRLAAYEDTGLGPEEIKEHEAAYTEIMTRTYGPLHQKIGQWLQAEQDGRLMVLPPNDPLTLEELREMDGDPVWVQPAKPGGKIPARWMLLECTSKDKDLYLFTPPSGIAQGYKGTDYGKTWLAYRRKPEEGTA